MSENKFIKHLRGEQTARSVLEIKNQRTTTSFANMPDGDTSNANDVYSDHRGNATGVLKGTENWKLDGEALLESATVYGDGRDFTNSYDASGNTLWVDATYTFATARRFMPNTKFVLKLCGHDLETALKDTVDFTLIVKFGTNNLISKTFTVKEQAFDFCKEFVIDFAESNSSTIKVDAGSTLQIQLLCADANAQAVIYNGMTVFTALQRRVDGETVASDKKTFDEVVQDIDDINEEIDDIHEDIDDLEDYVDDTFVRLDGNSIMTGPLKMRATSSFQCAIAPFWDGVGFFKLNADNSVTLIASIDTPDGFLPWTTNTYNIGSSLKKWKDLYLAGKAYVATVNNGADILIPTTGGTMALLSDILTNLSDFGVTATASELNYVAGVTGPIQSQIDNKENLLTAGSNISLSTITTVGKNKLDANVDGIKTTATPSSNLALNFTKWYLGSAFNGYMNQSSISGFTYGVGTITFRSSDASYGCVRFLRLKPSTTYTISCASPTANHRVAIMCYNDNGNDTYKATTQIVTPTALPYSFTTNADPTQVYGVNLYSPANTEITYTNILLEEGNQATAYAPYSVIYSTEVSATDTTYTAGTGISISGGTISNTQTVNNPTITITQGGATKGSFTLNQVSGDTIALDAGGGSSLPSQTGHAGEFLTTDGTDASWATPSIVAARNVGDIFFTMRTDSGLNGAVMCDGGTYDTSDYSGTESIGALLTAGKIPYVSLSTYASMLTADGSVGVFGWDGVGTTTFRVPSLNDIFIETGTAAQIGDYVAPGLPNITGSIIDVVTPEGAFYNIGTVSSANSTAGGSYDNKVGFSASLSNSIYGNSATVQPNTVRYRAMVQLFVTATDAAVATCTSVASQVGTNTSNISGLQAHALVAFQAPTAGNNYTWYRKYADGWVEQGGQQMSGKGSVSLPIAMADAYYTALCTNDILSSNIHSYALCIGNKTITGFEILSQSSPSAPTAWQVSGMAA